MSAYEHMTPSAMYTAALELVQSGISVIPIQPGTKEPPVGFRWGEYTTRFADASEIYEWFEDKGWQIAVVCGPISGNLVVIDFDRRQFADGGFSEYAERFPAILDLPRVKTGKGRVHVYCRASEPTDKYVIGEPGDQIEVRSGNHYCVAPPSLHPETGTAYVWSARRSISDGVPVIDLPAIGFETRKRAVTPAGDPGSEGEPLIDAEIDRLVEFSSPFWKEGQRHHLSMALAGWMAGYSVPESDAQRVIGALCAHEPISEQRDFYAAVRSTYRRWREGFAVAGWSMLTDSKAPLITRAAAAQLEWLLKGRQATITFDVSLVSSVVEDALPYMVTLRQGLKEPRKADVWVVDGIMRDESINIIAGPPKTFKSFFVQELCLSVASGTPFLGQFAVSEPRRVLYIQEESARSRLWDRFDDILRGRGMHPGACGDDIFVVTNQGVRLDSEDSIRRLISEAIDQSEPGLVIFDPLREMHWQDENKAEAMLPVLRVLKDIRNHYKIAVAVVHHNNKNPIYTNPADSIRGSSAIWGAMDGGIFFSTTEAEKVIKVQFDLKEGGQVQPSHGQSMFARVVRRLAAIRGRSKTSFRR